MSYSNVNDVLLVYFFFSLSLYIGIFSDNKFVIFWDFLDYSFKMFIELFFGSIQTCRIFFFFAIQSLNAYYGEVFDFVDGDK